MPGRESNAELDLAARVARLTAGQRACLELVDDHATSKEIALRLGISRHTVDARLRQAMQTLGVLSRREAAVIWRAASGMEAYQPFAYQSPQIEPLEPGRAERTPTEEFGSDVGSGGDHGAADGGGHGPAIPAYAVPAMADFGMRREAMEVAEAAPLRWDTGADAAVHAMAGPSGSSGIRLWGGANDLTPAQRLVGVLVVALLGMLAFGLLLSGIEALTNLRH